jgi:hypothetical protein
MSYALYLVHWPAIVFARQMQGGMDAPDRLLLMALCFLIAVFIQHAVEDPVRYRFKGITRARIFQAYGASGAAALAACVVVLATDGMARRFSNDALRIASFATEWDIETTRSCQVAVDGNEPVKLCPIGAPGKEPTWLIYGDSHAGSARHVFDAWLMERGEAGLFGFRAGCVPLLGLGMIGDRDGCAIATSRILDLAKSDRQSPPNVLLVSKWRQVVGGRLTSQHRGYLSQSEAVAAFDAAFRDTLGVLNEKGKRVFVWAPVPGGRKPVSVALARSFPVEDPIGLEYTRSEYERTFQFFFRALADNKAIIAGVISPSTALCATGACRVRDGQIPLYSDEAHITRASQATWLRIVAEAIPPSTGTPK